MTQQCNWAQSRAALLSGFFVAFFLFFSFFVTFFCAPTAFASGLSIPSQTFVEGDRWLKLEWAADHLLHFEFGKGNSVDLAAPIHVSPLYKHSVFQGSSTFRSLSPQKFITRDMAVAVQGLCFTVNDRIQGNQAGSYCLNDIASPWKTLQVEAKSVRDAYGLGQIFGEPGKINGNRIGKNIQSDGDFGNMMQAYAGGAVGQTLFPVLYALEKTDRAWLLALDNIYKQAWDLRTPTWKIGMFGDRVAGFVMVGANPLDLRKKFMDLSGHAPVPPRKIFGFWMSEYGYDNWAEIDERLEGMRNDQFPIDGFFLDLQWFGNVSAGSDYTSMGKLTFDESKFPEPRGHFANYKRKGIGLIPIEESYIGKALPEHKNMSQQGFLAHECGRPTVASYLTGQTTGNTSEWWGRGGMIDWSNKAAGAYWHDNKRRNLANLGVIGHWLDLGEPEMFDAASCYAGSGEPGKDRHQDVHNVFSLLWAESLYDGYTRNKDKQRPYSILRSGNVGIQRYGAGMWSGDIGGNLESLSAHLSSHNQMSWSGIDYYSSDIGGFHRNRASGQPLSELETQENFTLWFANAAWFDVPFRSHVMNLDNDRKTAPNRVGHIESNKANLIQRYRLTPYYYSLAWKAWTQGAPMMQPMSMAYPEDLRFRETGDQRMLGDVMVAAAATKGVYHRTIQMPEGVWYDLRNGSSFYSDGSPNVSLKGVPVYVNGLFQLPAFARGGALIPVLSEASMRLLADGIPVKSTGEELALEMFIGSDGRSDSFTLYEDDGETVSYRNGAVRETVMRQKTIGDIAEIVIEGAKGTFSGASDNRRWVINVHGPTGTEVEQVLVSGEGVAMCTGKDEPDVTCIRKGSSPGSLIEIIFGLEDVSVVRSANIRLKYTERPTANAHFACRDNDPSQRYYSMYAVGSDHRLGAWDVSKSIPLATNSFLRGIWTGVIAGLPASSDINWKCVKIHPQSSDRGVEWQPGQNNVLHTQEDGGFSGMTEGSFVHVWKSLSPVGPSKAQ